MLDKSNADPLYLQVKHALRHGIHSGDYPPASRLPSQIALTKVYGVSQITVQRAIQELVEEGLLIARPGSGTYVVETEQLAEARGHLRSIGIIFKDVIGGYPLIKQLLRAVRDECRAHGYTLQLLEVPPEDGDKDGADLSVFAGAILNSPVNIGLLNQLQRQKVPYVLLHNDVVDGVSHNVSCHYALGVMLAARHLFEQGCETLALVTAEETRYSAGQMAMGLQMAYLAENKNDASAQTITAHYTYEAGFDVVRRWVERKQLPDGIIFASDELARGGLAALDRMGISVPRQVAVVGFGDASAGLDVNPQLTMVDAHNERTGRAAFEIIEQLIEQKKPASHRILVEPELVVRASSLRKGAG